MAWTKGEEGVHLFRYIPNEYLPIDSASSSDLIFRIFAKCSCFYPISCFRVIVFVVLGCGCCLRRGFVSLKILKDTDDLKNGKRDFWLVIKNLIKGFDHLLDRSHLTRLRGGKNRFPIQSAKDQNVIVGMTIQGCDNRTTAIV